MLGRKIKSYTCAHCGYEIAAVYETADGQQLHSAWGIRLTVVDAGAGTATLECPSCLKQTPTLWREFQTKPHRPRAVVVKPS